MFKPDDLANLLFFDIETAHGVESIEAYNHVMRRQWEKRAAKEARRTGEEAEDLGKAYTESAAISAEFGRVVCISMGCFRPDSATGGMDFYVSSAYGTNERAILQQFAETLNKWIPNPAEKQQHRLVGHNILGFDVPYLCRRYLINKLPLPAALNISHRTKPWDLSHLEDTLVYWKFTDGRAFVSLELLCGVFDIPTPKDELGGAYVSHAYWNDNRHSEIAAYCEADVVATARVAMALSGMEVFGDEIVKRASEAKVFMAETSEVLAENPAENPNA